MIALYKVIKEKIDENIYKFVLSKKRLMNTQEVMYFDDSVLDDETFKNNYNNNDVVILYTFENKNKYFIDDITFDETELDKIRKRCIFYFLQKRINFNLIGLMSIQIYYYLRMYFKIKGFEFTEETKEDDYINILNSDNEELINNLQNYLQIQDNVSNFGWTVEKCYDFIILNKIPYQKVFSILI